MEEMALALLRCQKDTLIMIKDRERHSKSGRVIEGSNGRVARLPKRDQVKQGVQRGRRRKR